MDPLRIALELELSQPAPPVLTDEQHGEVSAWCMTRDEEWISRRVERIELVDDETVRRQVSIDFTLPDWLALPGTIVYVPVAILRKSPLSNFNIWQEDGARISILNRTRNERISVAALTSLARKAAAEQSVELPDESPLFGRLREIGDWRISVASSARDAIRREYPQLLETKPFATAVAALTEGFQVLVQVEMRPTRTRLVKLSYDEGIEWMGGGTRTSRVVARLTRWPLESIGLAAKRCDVSLQGIERGQSYHLEAVAPDELDIRHAAILLRDDRRKLWRTISEGDGRQRVHLIPDQWHGTGETRLRLSLRPQRNGVVLAHVATATLAATELWLGLPHLRELEPQTGAALLLLLPSLLAGFLVRPGEHSFASRMLAGVRVLTVTAALAAVFAAGALATFGGERMDETPVAAADRLDHLHHLWSISAWVAGVCGAILLVGYALSARWRNTALNNAAA